MHLPVYGDDGRAAMHKSHLVGKWEGFKDDTMQTCRCEAREAQTAVDKS